MKIPRLIGVVHLGPLPGSPGYDWDLEAVIEAAVADATTLAAAGFEAVLVENFGDFPFFAEQVPPVTVAAMTAAVVAIGRETSIPMGVNVLRNDAAAALAIAAATGAAFIRVNVLTGMMITDQGPIVGRAADVQRLRASLAAEVAVLADVFVKHAVPPPGLDIRQAAVDTVGRGLADGLVVTGPATGTPPDPALLSELAGLVKVPVLVGSGAELTSLESLLTSADGVIVGTSIKRDGIVTQRVDPDRAAAFAQAFRATITANRGGARAS